MDPEELQQLSMIREKRGFAGLPPVDFRMQVFNQAAKTLLLAEMLVHPLRAHGKSLITTQGIISIAMMFILPIV